MNNIILCDHTPFAQARVLAIVNMPCSQYLTHVQSTCALYAHIHVHVRTAMDYRE